MARIVILDAASFGSDMDLSPLEKIGELVVHDRTPASLRGERIRGAEIAVSNKVELDGALLASPDASSLKLICIAATGTNNVDLAAAASRGIAVSNVTGYSTESVVQHTFALLLHLVQKVHLYDQLVKSGDYSRGELFTDFRWKFSLIQGKTWGIIGLGSIGMRVAQVASAFGARVIHYSPTGKHRNTYYPQVEMEELLRDSDILSIHAPLSDVTRNLLDRERLSRMKPSSILINVGRGGIIHEEDLARILDEGGIAGACVDVFTQEPLPENHPLLCLKHPERIVLTPHNAWAATEARIELIAEIADNVRAFQEGKRRNRVDQAKDLLM